MRNFKLILLVVLVSLTGGVLGAAAQDRLSAIFNVGQGNAGNKAMVFDSGGGANNAQVTSTAATNLGLATSGVTTVAASSSGATVNAANGSAATPSLSFLNDLDTGMYRQTTNQVGFAANGLSSAVLSSTQFQGPPGTVGSPTWTFIADPDTGLYSQTANQMGVATNGATSAIFSETQVQGPPGTVGSPTWTFVADPDTGLYRRSANQLALTTGGVDRFVIDSAGAYFVNGVSTDNLGAADAIKWKICTGSLVASGTTTCATGGTIVAASGWSERDGLGLFVPIESITAAGGANDRVTFNSSSGTSTVGLINDDATDTNAYRVVVFYQ